MKNSNRRREKVNPAVRGLRDRKRPVGSPLQSVQRADGDQARFYVVPEPGDENLSPMMLDWEYHLPFEGTAFRVRSSPDRVLLAELQQRKKRPGRKGRTKP